MKSSTPKPGRWRRALALALALLPLAAAAGDVMDRIARRGQINIGFRDESPPFSFVDNGQPVGYSIELCQGIVERIRAELNLPELPVRYFPVPADQMVRLMSSSGTIDLLCAGTSDTEERRKSMAFSTPIFITAAKFMVRKQDGITSAAQLKGQPVSIVGRTTAETAVPAYSKDKGLALKVSPALNPDAAFGLLALGQVRAYVRDEVMLLNQLSQQKDPAQYLILPEEVSEEVNAIVLPKGDPLLQKAVDQGLALQVRSRRAAELYLKWFIKPHAGSPAGLGLPMSPQLKAEFDRLR